MPYITKLQRSYIDLFLDDVSKNISSVGELNYAITMLLLKYVERKGGPSYSLYNDVAGVLSCADKEFYRCYVVPYEEEKRLENGDL